MFANILDAEFFRLSFNSTRLQYTNHTVRSFYFFFSLCISSSVLPLCGAARNKPICVNCYHYDVGVWQSICVFLTSTLHGPQCNNDSKRMRSHNAHIIKSNKIYRTKCAMNRGLLFFLSLSLSASFVRCKQVNGIHWNSWYIVHTLSYI